jgi:hypothetical protein
MKRDNLPGTSGWITDPNRHRITIVARLTRSGSD